MFVDQVLEKEELKLVDHLPMEKEAATELMLIVDQVTVEEKEEATELNVVGADGGGAEGDTVLVDGAGGGGTEGDE